MRRLLPILALLCLAQVAHGAAAVVQEKSGTGTSLTLNSATTIGNSFGVQLSSGSAGTVKIGTQTLSQIGQCAVAVSSLVLCSYATASLTVASTAVTCTGCGTSNAINAVEFSGTNAVENVVGCFSQIASSDTCQISNAGTASILGIRYQPGYSSEGVMFLGTCSGSSTTPTVSNLTGGSTALPNSNPAAWGISSGTAVTAMIPSSACNQSNSEALAFVGTGSTQQPVANPNDQADGTEVTASAATATIFVFNVGDLVTVHPWCLNSCTMGTLTVGAQTATCPAGTQGVSNTNTGQPNICYVIATSAGSQTVSFTPGGSPTHWQVSAQDYTVSNNTTVSFDKGASANCASSCTEGTTVTTPSITPTNTGSLLENFVATLNHVSGPGTGWSCYAYINTGGNQNCQTRTTQNQTTWILNSAAGSTSANTVILTNNDPFQSIIAAFSLSASAGATAVPRRRFGVF